MTKEAYSGHRYTGGRKMKMNKIFQVKISKQQKIHPASHSPFLPHISPVFYYFHLYSHVSASFTFTPTSLLYPSLLYSRVLVFLPHLKSSFSFLPFIPFFSHFFLLSHQELRPYFTSSYLSKCGHSHH